MYLALLALGVMIMLVVIDDPIDLWMINGVVSIRIVIKK